MKLFESIVGLAAAIQMRSGAWTLTDAVGFALIGELLFFIVLAVVVYKRHRRKLARTAVPDAIQHVRDEGAAHDAFEAKLRT